MIKDPLKAEFKLSILRVRDGILLAGFTLIIAFPHIYDQAHSLFPRIFSEPATPEKLKPYILAELILYFFSIFLFSLVGILANKRAELNPFKSPGLKNILNPLILGICIIPLSYLLYDHLILALVPESYPHKLSFAIIYPFSASFPQEMVNRFGLLSLLAWVFGKTPRNRILANLLCSAIIAGFSWFDFNRILHSPLTLPELIMFLLAVFITQYIAGALYLKYGFFSSLSFKFGLALKFPLFFLLFFRN